MRTKWTKEEKSWILYDVANSAFIMLIATIIPIYLDTLIPEGASNTVYMGYTTTIVTLLVAVLGPILGAISDNTKKKMQIFFTTVLIGVIACILLSIPMSYMGFLVVFAIAKLGANSSFIFYDSMLVDITTEDNMDNISAQGYACGYIGSCIPFICCLLLVLYSQTENPLIGFQLAMSISFIVTGLWWLILTLPLVKNYKQKGSENSGSIKDSFKELLNTFKEIVQTKHILIFIIAFFFYIDAVYTIIDLATSYGKDLGLGTTDLLIALLVTQIVAFPCSLFFGMLSKKVKVNKLLLVCIIAYTVIAMVAVFMTTTTMFWILAVLVGMFQGAIQALTRSYFTKIVPQEKTASYFALLDICGKGSSALGTFLVSTITVLTGSPTNGIIVLPVMMVIGLVLYLVSDKLYNNYKSENGVSE